MRSRKSRTVGFRRAHAEGTAGLAARRVSPNGVPWRGRPAVVNIGGGCPPTSSVLGAVSPRVSLIAGSRRQGPTASIVIILAARLTVTLQRWPAYPAATRYSKFPRPTVRSSVRMTGRGSS